MKKVAVIGVLLILTTIIFNVNLVKNKNSQINSLNTELYEANQSYEKIDSENKDLKKEIDKLKAELKDEKSKRTSTTTSRSLNTKRKTVAKITSSTNKSKWNDLELFARIINAEAGDCSDEHQLLVGNVILNRVQSSYFPNTLYGVIYQKGQYSPTWNGAINKKPSKQAYKNAQRLLDGERFCPTNVLFQANFKQGKGVYKTIKTKYSTTYFCYK